MILRHLGAAVPLLSGGLYVGGASTSSLKTNFCILSCLFDAAETWTMSDPCQGKWNFSSSFSWELSLSLLTRGRFELISIFRFRFSNFGSGGGGNGSSSSEGTDLVEEFEDSQRAQRNAAAAAAITTNNAAASSSINRESLEDNLNKSHAKKRYKSGFLIIS